MQLIDHFPPAGLMPSVATIGFFDGVHRGHRFLLEQVKEIAAQRGLEAQAITFSAHPRQVLDPSFTPTLLTTTQEKCALLETALMDRCVLLPFTRELSQLSAADFMRQLLREQLNVKVLVIGYDHHFGHNRHEGFEDYVRYGKELDMEVVQAKACKVSGSYVSSSRIRLLLTEGEVVKANRLLGYAYSFKGTVIKGFKVGRQLGFPTANLQPDDPYKLIPAEGVYAVQATVEGQTSKGMMYIGNRPTLHRSGAHSIEVNLQDFEADIYGKELLVTLVKRMRDEIPFDSMESLRRQLKQDAARLKRMKF